jgi:hypothetical protein
LKKIKNRIREQLSFSWLIFFLFPVFFLLHANNENFGLLSVDILGTLLVKYFLVVIILVLFSMLLYSKRGLAMIFCFFLLSVYFFFGALHDASKFYLGAFFSSYSFLLPFLLVITTLVGIFLRSVKNSQRYSKFIVLLLLVLTGFESGHLFLQAVSNAAEKNDLSNAAVPINEVSCSSSSPDIYFIVFDGYTSSSVLKKEFMFDNVALDSALTSKGFYLAQGSSSNYNATPYSLSATLNMNYLKPGLGNRPISSKDFLQAIETLKKTDIVKFFSNQGYTIFNYGCFDLDLAPSPTIPYFRDYTIAHVDGQTFISRLFRDIGFHFLHRKYFFGEFEPSSAYIEQRDYHLYRNRHNLDKLKEEIESIDTLKKFVYAHIMMPHEPFYLKEDGTLQPDSLIIKNTLDLREGYISQVKYTNQLMGELLKSFKKGRNKPKVVIIMGDHGYRYYALDAEKNKEFPILNAYYFPDETPVELYDSISPVNSFRLVLNRYFCQDLPFLSDSSIYISPKDSF